VLQVNVPFVIEKNDVCQGYLFAAKNGVAQYLTNGYLEPLQNIYA
jgi:hypothetical protein